MYFRPTIELLFASPEYSCYNMIYCFQKDKFLKDMSNELKVNMKICKYCLTKICSIIFKRTNFKRTFVNELEVNMKTHGNQCGSGETLW